jgi:ABC-type transport system involved in multi-copper enzyme maturation permease subunit
MTRLLTVEIHRLLIRRMTRFLLLLAMLGILIAAVVMLFRADAGFGLTDFRAILLGTTVPLVLTGWVVGASFIGAEWRAGTVATMLTWEPRRHRVFLSKAAAVILVTMVLTVALQLLLTVFLLPAAAIKGTLAGAGAEWLRGLAGVVLRGAALAGMAAGIGFAVATFGRNTSVALGIGFLYLAILEGLLLSLSPGLQPWLLVPNSVAFVSGQPLPGVTARSALVAGLTLAAYTVGVLALTLASFKARDIT